MSAANQYKQTSWGLHGLGFASTVLGIGLAGFWVFYPLQTEKNACANKVKEYRLFLESAENTHSTNQELKQSLQEMQGKLSMFLEKIPESPNEADFLASLTKLAKETKLVIHDYRPSLAIDQKTYKEMEISISAEGSYSSICRFFHGLNQIPRASHIVELEILSGKDPSMTQQVEMTLGIYFAPVNNQKIAAKN